jgi:hypothetical protein
MPSEPSIRRADRALAIALIEWATVNCTMANFGRAKNGGEVDRQVENGPEYQKSRGSSDGSGIVKVDRREHDNRGHDCTSRAIGSRSPRTGPQPHRSTSGDRQGLRRASRSRSVPSIMATSFMTNADYLDNRRYARANRHPARRARSVILRAYVSRVRIRISQSSGWMLPP